MSRFSAGETARDARSLRELRKLVKEGQISIEPRHQYKCTLQSPAFDLRIRLCNCGAEERAREVNKLLEVEQKPLKKNEEVEWDEEAEHYDYD